MDPFKKIRAMMAGQVGEKKFADTLPWYPIAQLIKEIVSDFHGQPTDTYLSNKYRRLYDLCTQRERIEAAAVRVGTAVLWLPAPARHHNVLFEHPCCKVMTDEELNTDQEQGFYTNKGRFVNRQEARALALAAGQVLDMNELRPRDLYSEDLW